MPTLLRFGRSLIEPGRAANQECGGRAFQDELERTIREDGDLGRDDLADAVAGARVVFLAEAHQVDTMLSQRRANRRRRVSFACIDLQGDNCFYFFRHDVVPYCVTKNAPRCRGLPVDSACW